MENIGDPNKLLERFARRVVRKAYEKAGRPRSEFRNAWKHRNDSVFPYDDEDIYQGAGQVNPYITSDYDEYLSRKQAYADSLKNYNAAVEFDRIKSLLDGYEKYESAKQYANKYFDKIDYSDVDKYPSDMIRGVFDGAYDSDVLGLYIPRNGIKSGGDEYMRGYSGWNKTSYELAKAGDRSMKPFQKVIYQKKPKTYNYEISREVSYPNTDDAQIWRILIGRNEYNLNPNAADFEQYKEPRYRGINSVVTDADRDAWNKRFSIEPFTREMTDEEAAELENQGYTVKKRQQEAKQKGGEMDVSDVILGVQGDKPYEYAYYEDNDDYDYEAAERDGVVAGEDGHMSDRYKKSNHPTYSTESTEHAGQYLGGRWVYPEDSSWRYDNGSPVFVPSEFNKEVIWDRYHMSPEAFYAMYSDLTRDKVLLPEFQMAGENNTPIRRFQGGKESKVPLNTPYVFSEKAPEGYYPTVENEEGMYSPLLVEPTVTVQASPSPYSKGWYALRPNKYNPYLPLEQQSKEAQADYIAQHTREATAKAAPYVAGTLLATAALPYAVSSGIGLAKGIGDFGSFLATTAGRQAAANTGKRLLFDTALGMGAWNASNDVSQDITGKSLDSHISEGMQYMGVPEGVADVASSFINPFGYLGASAMEGAAKSLPYMIDRTKNVLSKTWNNPDSKFLQNVFPSRAIKLLDKEESKTNELYNSIAETQKNASEKQHELNESLRYKTLNLESDEERDILFKQLYHADSGRNLKFKEEVPIEKHLKGSKEEPLSYTDLNGNEIKANAVLRTGNGELKTDINSLYVKDGKIQNENILTVTTTDDRMNYFEPSSNDVQKAIYNDYQKISSDMGESGVVGGSYALYSHGITGSPHDLEVYTTQSKLKNLEKSLGLNHTTTGAMVENYTSKYAENNPAHNVQVCIIDGNGKTSWGHNAESIYASLHPEEYFKLRESYSFNKLGKRITGDMKIEIPMSPDQLLQEMKNNPDALVKKVFIDNIVSGKGKHAQRIYEAALSQPKLMNECISTINKSMFGRDFQISELYPSIDLTDIEANKELLNLIGYDEKYATDPEVMESVFRLFDTEATWGTAGAKDISDKRWGNQIINSATSKHNAAGAGANMARSPIGGGEHYAYEGLMTIRRFLLSHESNKINNVSDYLKQLKRLNAASEERVSNILTPKQIETFNHFMTTHNMPNYIGTLTKDNTAQEMFVKINNIQSELNNKFGDFEAASNELMNLYRELDLPFLYDASERTSYRSTRHIGLNKDILSGGYFGGLSRPIAYGTKNSALYRPSARLEGSQLRMENAHVYDVMDIFNPKTSTSSYGNMQLDDQLKSILEKKVKNAEDAVRKDYTQLLNKDLQIYPYYMTQDVLPSQKAREIGKTIENEYIPLALERFDLRNQLSSLSDKLQDIHDRQFVLGLNRDSNRSALVYASGVSFGAAALIGGIYGLINYIDKDSNETAQRSQKAAEQENKWLKHLGVPFENIRDVRTELNAGYTKYNEGRLRGKWKPFPEWAEENSDLVNDILTKYRK